MNSVVLIGRLTRDPEVKYLSQDQRAVASFSVAVDRMPKKDGTKETDFIRIAVFGRQAENCGQYLNKGRRVGIQGRLRIDSYTNKEGVKVNTAEVVADRVEFLEWGDRQQQAAQPQQFAQPQEQLQPQEQAQAQPQMPEAEAKKDMGVPEGFQALEDEDIPF